MRVVLRVHPRPCQGAGLAEAMMTPRPRALNQTDKKRLDLTGAAGGSASEREKEKIEVRTGFTTPSSREQLVQPTRPELGGFFSRSRKNG